MVKYFDWLGWWSGQSHETVNLAPYGYVGSNPTPSTAICLVSSVAERFLGKKEVLSPILRPGSSDSGVVHGAAVAVSKKQAQSGHFGQVPGGGNLRYSEEMLDLTVGNRGAGGFQMCKNRFLPARQAPQAFGGF